MALEDQIARLADAVEAQNERLDKIMAGGGTVASGKPATKAADKPAAAAKKPAAAAKKTGPTVDDIAKRFGAYLKSGSSEEREQAKANVTSIVEYFGVPKATAIPEESFEEALGYLDQFEAGETPEFDGGEDEGGEDEDGALV